METTRKYNYGCSNLLKAILSCLTATDSIPHAPLPIQIYANRANNTRYTQKVVNPHTNLTEITQGLDLLWRNNIPSKKVVLGLGFYGRSFTLANPSCKEPGCPFSSGANPGDCTKTSGVLSNSEIQRIIRDKGIEPILDEKAGVKYMSWDSDQWVSYDDADTFKMKMDFANKLGLGGTSKWLRRNKTTSQS